MALLKNVIPNCRSVIKTDAETDRRGIDYIAYLTGGAKINIDAKARRKGAVKPGEDPPLALELWSVCPDKAKNVKGKPGWTWSQRSDVDMILYTFDPEECDMFYLVPFQHLRMAFQHNARDWMKTYKPRRQNNKSWQSEAIFVPAPVVLAAVAAEMTGKIPALQDEGMTEHVC